MNIHSADIFVPIIFQSLCWAQNQVPIYKCLPCTMLLYTQGQDTTQLNEQGVPGSSSSSGSTNCPSNRRAWEKGFLQWSVIAIWPHPPPDFVRLPRFTRKGPFPGLCMQEAKRWGNNLTKQETKPDVKFYKVVKAGLPLMKLVPFTATSRALCLFSAQAGWT